MGTTAGGRCKEGLADSTTGEEEDRELRVLSWCMRWGREGEEKSEMDKRLRRGGLVLDRGRRTALASEVAGPASPEIRASSGSGDDVSGTG